MIKYTPLIAFIYRKILGKASTTPFIINQENPYGDYNGSEQTILYLA
jgi:hypothetical protein